MPSRLAIAIVIALVSIVGTRSASGATRLCLSFRADADAVGFRKLVEDELAHYPSHKLVSEEDPSGCDSRLTVEIFTAGAARYITARVNSEVPVRFSVRTPKDIEEKLNEALRQVLSHDPVYLAEDMSRMNSVMRQANHIIKSGLTRYRLELFEVIGSGGHNAVFASGGAFTASRGIDHFQVFARLDVAGSPRNVSDGDVMLRVMAGGEVGVLWEQSERGNTTFYIGPGAGLHYMRFEGQRDASEMTPADTFLLSVLVRTGARFMRFYGFDFDLFVQGQLPLYKTRDPDTTLIDAYTPFVMAGLGVGF